MERPRLKLTTERFETPDGDTYLLRSGADVEVRIERPDEHERELLDALEAGTRTLAQLRAEFGAELVDDSIAALGEHGVIEDVADYDRLPAAELARFDRQVRYFSDIGDSELTPSERQGRLRGSTVAVLGSGGLGTWSAWAIACLGVGEMRVIDSDLVEPSNLNRQIFFTAADVGRPKAEIAAERLAAFDPAMKVAGTVGSLGSEAEIAEFVAGADVVIDAVDTPALEIEHWCNRACFEVGVPYITMSHFPPIARVGPLYVPGRTGCFLCQTTALKRRSPRLEAWIAERTGKPNPSATLGPACGLIGGQIGMEVVHLLTGLVEPATLGRSFIYDLTTMELRHEAVIPEPDCPVCGHLQPTPPMEEVCGG